MLMRIDANFFCTVPMPDAGDPNVPATARRYGMDAVLECYRNLLAWAKTADELGFDTMWLTEHHFQYEGYEVLPNLIQFGQHLATQTEQLRLGQMFNVVPQWHPLRLAEDFAIADIITGGRMEFGIGRGTVPREAPDVPARRRARLRHVGARPDPDPPPAATGGHLPADLVAGDHRVRATGRAQGRLLAEQPRQPEAEVGPLRRDPRGDRLSRRSRRGPLPGAQRARRAHHGGGPAQGPPRPRRVRQVPRAVRPLRQLPGPGRQQGPVRLRPHRGAV